MDEKWDVDWMEANKNTQIIFFVTFILDYDLTMQMTLEEVVKELHKFPSQTCIQELLYVFWEQWGNICETKYREISKQYCH